MALTTHDLALALRSLEGAQTLTLDGFELTLIRVLAGERHDLESPVGATLLVLDGLGTVHVDDWRASLAGGFVVSVPARKRLTINADAGAPVHALLTRASAPPTVDS